ncbi:hypothetical protein FOPG_10252 [Fusarium oxysporum f. sp. conglutinans race 2 54008]|uniref:Uncharacterized protein n=2 Tax=Fusarium oxysporum TaxID=5507 RepID=X0LID9_FUSOX|nr:hypothetical protein FOPG_10252 [Fusarium oxysporum f. sp. conglutinans race 2 54008]EXM20932.1 hypothetical protein FOTG_11068 [Fusarium oxysporum f. sp. vasinfectum 25433]
MGSCFLEMLRKKLNGKNESAEALHSSQSIFGH